jgi:hypothetical protein
MRHEKIVRPTAVDEVEIAAVWPASAQVAPAPIPETFSAENFRPTPAAPDVPASVGAMIVAANAAVIGALYFATAGTAFSIFMITISALFVVAFFTVPRIFLGVEPKSHPRTSLDRFLHQGIETLTGHTGGRDALVQILIVPVLLAAGIFVMGIAAAIIL